ncbi:MAG: TlpA family protein disulfide reductase [Chloroflexi bacterium]|nr:TlpA family protein disulfide reductase [Chloroflexota bacterium]
MRQFGIFIIVALLIAACGGAAGSDPTPRVRVVGDRSTATSTTIPSSPTPSPTPLIVPTLASTPRNVRVTRINDDVDPSSAQLLEAGQPAPPITITDINGNQYRLDELDGKIIVLNFWTIGCGSCFFEFPVLQEIYADTDRDDLLVLGVNVSELAQETRILAYQLGIEFPMVVDPQGAVFNTHFGGTVVPTTYFIDQQGGVFDVVVGPIDMYNLQTRLAELGLEFQDVRGNTPPPLQPADG